ncbi:MULTISPECIES: hypothetical protein [Streptomyces]|uniref:Uncharacterized protein n=1 Tax=Streptomyces doudnae TaxID=3075536 RepID=A0ABD5F028_9ACTN|nr:MULTISPECIES: hypothetical protein [unclassified Streptomyces]MDT0439012.1 hypothetical protein [Streptomyces sp. DSM 41981]MYQ63818.1 hypothetical protein [Streptomyces sp. SID4950]SCD66237.1 hypothetical protein GA0115242_111428 [Streptomyces sp. SolWspMP-5a-2]
MSAERVLGSRDDATAVRAGERARAALVWAVDASAGDPSHAFRVTATGPWGTAGGRGYDLLDALDRVRRALEEAGWLLAINAARPDVAQSGMLRDSGSTRAYRLTPGRRGRREDLVDLFDDAPADAVTTLDAQRAAYLSWLASL